MADGGEEEGGGGGDECGSEGRGRGAGGGDGAGRRRLGRGGHGEGGGRQDGEHGEGLGSDSGHCFGFGEKVLEGKGDLVVVVRENGGAASTRSLLLGWGKVPREGPCIYREGRSRGVTGLGLGLGLAWWRQLAPRRQEGCEFGGRLLLLSRYSTLFSFPGDDLLLRYPVFLFL